MSQARDGMHIHTCPLCEAMCGLEITVKGGRVEKIRANKDDVWSKGYICPKGTALGELHHDPDRLRAPLVRRGDTFHEVQLGRGVRRGGAAGCARRSTRTARTR
jgi:anaerobic selenocysteine-containing dehydrogenase